MQIKAAELAAAIKAQVASGNAAAPGKEVRHLASQCNQLHSDFRRELRRVQRALGLSQSEIRAIEQQIDADSLPVEVNTHFWRADVEDFPPTGWIDDLIEHALKRLLTFVNPKWLAAEAAKRYRLGPEFLKAPLHLVSGVRVGTAVQESTPQRFAQMLLLSNDYMMNQPDIDFFSAAMCVSEVAQLGNCIDEIRELGPEANKKLARLPCMTDEQVSATVFELLVGAACVRKGITLTMVEEDRRTKVPDYRITSFGALQGAIECKRRLGLTSYELREAKLVENLYGTIRPLLQQRGAHGSIEVSFRVPLNTVAPTEFTENVLMALDECASDYISTNWGSINFQPLPHRRSIPETRLYSPMFLESVFGWSMYQDEWDGILCEVEAPSEVMVEIYSSPLCLKWRSESEEALLKKSRGITALWAAAVDQIPSGDIGFVYVAYPEGSRAGLADARTRHIRDTAPNFSHRWSVRVPVTMVNRLYARPLGSGVPDLIESVISAVTPGQEFWLKKLPWRVFT